MASSQSPSGGSPALSGGLAYKRASRKGAPKRFTCDFPGCDKIYSRAEHLQRHQLNHNPREIHRCDVPGCEQQFVRLDLLARHKKRHNASYVPRNRVTSFATPQNQPAADESDAPSPAESVTHRPTFFQSLPTPGPRDIAPALTPELSMTPNSVSLPPLLPNHLSQGPLSTWPSPMLDRRPVNSLPPNPSYHTTTPTILPTPGAMAPFSTLGFALDEQLTKDNFATWLFDPQTNFNDFDMTGIPFLEAGLESTFNNEIHYDNDTPKSRYQVGLTPPNHLEAADELMTEARRQEVLHWFQVFRQKRPAFDSSIASLVYESRGDLPALNLEMMRDCLREYWESVSPRLPVIHRHTFFPNRSPIMLLLVMIALGAASRHNLDSTGRFEEYGGFANVIMTSVRWEILTSDDAQPPISLWVAQALLLLEFYEKLCASRELHERAHIYHSSFLTLLRRGNPLIGRAGSETPGEAEDGEDDTPPQQSNSLDSRTWWIRWAQSESMHRVVFGAFMLDILHAAMFGHAADMAAHEIRLPLPCDDSLWVASSPDVVREMDTNLRLYGVKQVSFLDGLKSALHGKEVKTHSFGRMIIMSGLFSVGWHLSHGETHLKWLDMRTSSTETRENWRKMLLTAFDGWKTSFDRVVGDSVLTGPSDRCGPVSRASLLYHLAHISLHVNIIDCQVFAGSKRVLGRKVSSRDYSNSVKRMSNWAKLSSTRHAVLHAFKLLYKVLVRSQTRRRNGPDSYESFTILYSVRDEIDPHRPWSMYYAVLSIWSFVYALGRPSDRPQRFLYQDGTYKRMAEYLSNVARLEILDEKTSSMLHDGLLELLQVMEEILGDARSDLLFEAQSRLKTCRELMIGLMR